MSRDFRFCAEETLTINPQGGLHLPTGLWRPLRESFWPDHLLAALNCHPKYPFSIELYPLENRDVLLTNLAQVMTWVAEGPGNSPAPKKRLQDYDEMIQAQILETYKRIDKDKRWDRMKFDIQGVKIQRGPRKGFVQLPPGWREAAKLEDEVVAFGVGWGGQYISLLNKVAFEVYVDSEDCSIVVD
jgi:hypothetical protein